MTKAVIYLSVFIIGFVGVSLWSFWLTIHPPKIILNQKPADFKLPAEEITITTKDNIDLSAWLIKPELVPSEVEGETLPNKKRAIVLLHGYPAEKSDMLSIASSLYPDFTILLLDLRYFGKSEGNHTTLGIKEKDDVNIAVDFLKSSGYEKIGVFGFSLGGATAMLSSNKNDKINAIASYAAFSDLRSLGREVYGNLSVLKYPLVELMIVWSKIFFGESIMYDTPIKSIGSSNIPTLIIHPKQDEQIPFTHAEKFKKTLRENSKAQFYFLENGLHGELPLDFNEKVKYFFDQTF